MSAPIGSGSAGEFRPNLDPQREEEEPGGGLGSRRRPLIGALLFFVQLVLTCRTEGARVKSGCMLPS